MNKRKTLSSGILALSAGLFMSVSPIAPQAHAMMYAPMAKGDDQISRSVVHLSEGVCTGVLIAPQWVLTANHCTLKPEDDSLAYVEKGSSTAIGPERGEQEERTITEIISHDKFDASLLKLDAPSTIIPAQVYPDEGVVPLGTKTVAYGWGDLLGKFDRKVGAQTGKIVDTVYSSAYGYDDMFGVNNKLDDKSLMVTGDSGGPLFLSDGRLYGVLSGGNLEDEKPGDSSTSVYSQLPGFISWMKQETGINFNDERNQEIAEKINANPYSFTEPNNSMYANTKEEDDKALSDYIAKVTGKKPSDEPLDGGEQVPLPQPQEVDKDKSDEPTTPSTEEELKDDSSSDVEIIDNETGEEAEENQDNTVIKSNGVEVKAPEGTDVSISIDSNDDKDEVKEEETNVDNSDSTVEENKDREQVDQYRDVYSPSHDNSYSREVGGNDYRSISPEVYQLPRAQRVTPQQPVVYTNNQQQTYYASQAPVTAEAVKVGPKVDTGGSIKISLLEKIVNLFH